MLRDGIYFFSQGNLIILGEYIKTDDIIASVKESHYKDKDMCFFFSGSTGSIGLCHFQVIQPVR